METVHNCFGSIGQLVQCWFEVHSTDPSIIADRFLQFGSLSGYAKSRCSFMLLIWFASSWMIWKERNDRIFRGKENSPIKFLENIKLLSFWWFKARCFFLHQFHILCQRHFLCLGVGY